MTGKFSECPIGNACKHFSLKQEVKLTSVNKTWIQWDTECKMKKENEMNSVIYDDSTPFQSFFVYVCVKEINTFIEHRFIQIFKSDVFVTL